MEKLKQGSNTHNLQEAKRFIGLLNNSYSDYLSARVLYNNEMLIQATILANTALEKYFKAYLEVMGLKINVQHDTFKIFQTVKSKSPKIASLISENYLRQLTKVYKCRYLESISPGYNFVILRKKFLAELDYTFSILEPLVRWENLRKEKGNLNYQVGKESVDPRLYHDNYILNEINKKEFIEATDFVHEFRMLFNHETLEMTYYTEVSKDDNEFNYIGIKPEDDNKTYHVSHLPIQ